jgi:hypothetical protein
MLPPEIVEACSQPFWMVADLNVHFTVTCGAFAVAATVVEHVAYWMLHVERDIRMVALPLQLLTSVPLACESTVAQQNSHILKSLHFLSSVDFCPTQLLTGIRFPVVLAIAYPMLPPIYLLKASFTQTMRS